MRVAMYVHWAGVGGAEDMAIDEIKYARDRVDYIFTTEEQSGWQVTFDELNALGVPVFRTKVGDANEYRQLYAERKVDAVHVFSCGDIQPGYQAALDRGLPVVDTAACVAYPAAWGNHSGVFPVYLCKKHWSGGSGGKKEFEIITGGVDIAMLGNHSEHEKRIYKTELGFDPNRPVVGWFGRFDQFKCPFSFIDIAASARERIPDCQFAMFGGGVDLGRSIYLANEKHVPIEFRGFTRAKGKAFGCMDVFMMPTWQEAFGRVLVEAMACGVPIVTSDYPVCQEVCEQAALYAPTVRSDPMPLANAKMFADQAVKILQDVELAEFMGVTGYTRSRQLYDAQRMANEYVALYRRICPGG
jgi:glycosyltransferase involved in cell wall biosynthesis